MAPFSHYFTTTGTVVMGVLLEYLLFSHIISQKQFFLFFSFYASAFAKTNVS